MTRVNIEIPDEVHKKAKVASAMAGISLKDLINAAIEEKLKKEGKGA
jgi:predicted HicB family RNase H-like nuclease